MTTQQAFALALQHHQAGRLGDAEALYRQILAAQPDHAEALHLIGVVAHQTGHHDLAVEWIRKAIAVAPDNHVAHANLGEAYRSAGQLDEATACYRRAIELHPQYALAYYNLGNALRERGQLDEAVSAYRHALRIKPDHAEAHNNLGMALAGLGQFDEAIAAYRRALQLKPDYAEAHVNWGNTLKDQGQLEEAVAEYQRALQLKSEFAEAHNNLGNALKDLGRLDDAIAAYHRTLQLKPDFAEAHSNLGNALFDQSQFDEAIASFRRALQLKPDYAEAHNNWGNALFNQGQLVEAAAVYRRALVLKPDFPETHNNLGLALARQGQMDEAMACFRRAIACRADFADAHLNLGLLLLLLGRYEEGWHEYEWHRHSPAHALRHRNFSAPLWDGKPAVGKTILVHADQGFGDTLQFLRYLPLVLAHSRAARVILECQPALVPLLKQLRSPETDIVARVASDEALPAFDLHVPLLSMPLALQCFEPVPMSRPLLHADAGFRVQWRERLGNRSGLVVGLAWAGNPLHKDDRRRSIAPEKLAPILRVPGLRFVSLQVEPRGPLPPTLAAAGVLDFAPDVTKFPDSAALIAELDLIISVDTATAHLAGTLGRPVWTLLPFVSDWRWGLESATTPWYPTMRLFRQTAAGDWDAVVQCVVEELSRVATVGVPESEL